MKSCTCANISSEVNAEIVGKVFKLQLGFREIRHNSVGIALFKVIEENLIEYVNKEWDEVKFWITLKKLTYLMCTTMEISVKFAKQTKVEFQFHVNAKCLTNCFLSNVLNIHHSLKYFSIFLKK